MDGAGSNQVLHTDEAGNMVPADGGSGDSGMSLNVHLAVPQQGEVGVGNNGSHTPNTPEILNSIVNMSAGPFSGYQLPQQVAVPSSETMQSVNPTEAALRSSGVPSVGEPGPSGGTPPPPAAPTTPSPTMSVQHYRTQFIKEGLKMKVRQKLGQKDDVKIPQVVVDPPSPLDEKPFVPSSDATMSPVSEQSSPVAGPAPKAVKEELTEEDEMRRQRRRERNKVAATKCRNKKKQRTIILMKESDTLEAQNKSLKSEIDKLEEEKKRLMEMLSAHDPSCAKRFREMTATVMSADHEQPMEREHPFRMPAAPAAATAPQRPASPPSLASVQRRYGGEGSSYAFGGDDIKTEEDMETEAVASASVQMQQQQQQGAEMSQHGDEASAEQSYLSSRLSNASCGFAPPPANSDYSGNFLAKCSIGQTFLDLDSRCIAL